MVRYQSTKEQCITILGLLGGLFDSGKKWASGTYGDITTIKSTSTQTLNIPISLNFKPTRIIIQIDSMKNNGYVTANKFSIDSFYVNSSSAYAYFPTSVNYSIKLYITDITQNSFNLKYLSSSSSYSWKISNVRWIAIE